MHCLGACWCMRAPCVLPELLRFAQTRFQFGDAGLGDPAGGLLLGKRRGRPPHGRRRVGEGLELLPAPGVAKAQRLVLDTQVQTENLASNRSRAGNGR